MMVQEWMLWWRGSFRVVSLVVTTATAVIMMVQDFIIPAVLLANSSAPQEGYDPFTLIPTLALTLTLTLTLSLTLTLVYTFLPMMDPPASNATKNSQSRFLRCLTIMEGPLVAIITITIIITTIMITIMTMTTSRMIITGAHTTHGLGIPGRRTLLHTSHTCICFTMHHIIILVSHRGCHLGTMSLPQSTGENHSIHLLHLT